MPYGRRRYRKKNYRRKGRNTSLAKKAYRLAKKAYKLPELKYNTDGFTWSNGTAPTTGVLVGLDQISQGTTNNTRIGDTVSPTSLKFKCNLVLSNSNSDNDSMGQQARMIIFRWISEAPASITDVLESTTINSFKSEDKRYQSEILYDRVFHQNAEIPVHHIERKLKINKHISYPEGSSVSNRNGIYMLVFGTGTSTTQATPPFVLNSRLFYRDC